MEIFVVNMDRSTQRLAEMTRRLERLNLPFTRTGAVDGADLDEDALNRYYSSSLNRRIYRRALSAGEIGCYLSHRNIWQTMVDSHLAMALVIEDDAELDAQLPKVLKTIENLSRPWDIIKLYEPPGKKPLAWTVPLNQDFHLCQYQKIPSRTTGYVVSLAGASKLLAARQSFGRPVDDDMQFYWEYSGAVFGVTPNLISTDESGHKSTIGPNGRPRSHKSLEGRLRGPLLRLRYEILRSYHNLRCQKIS